MNPESIPQKTEKGREEVAKRTYRLEARKRTLLILVDGRTDAAALAAKAAHLEDASAILDELAAQGFIEATGGAQPAAAPAAPAAGAARAVAADGAAAPGAPPLEALKRTAVLQIERLMGPDGEALALRIEKAATRDEFYAEARKVHAAMVSFLGARKAEAFATALRL